MLNGGKCFWRTEAAISVGVARRRSYPEPAPKGIARAIINNPPILTVDESTANLDPLTEKAIKFCIRWMIYCPL